MPRYESTDIYCLKSVEDVELFCKHLLRMKEEAPWSLQLTVALTASRDVEFRGSGNMIQHVGDDLRAISSELEKSHAIAKRPMRIRKPNGASKSRRHLDPPGY